MRMMKRQIGLAALIVALLSTVKAQEYNLSYLLISDDDTIGTVDYDNTTDTSYLDIRLDLYLLGMIHFEKKYLFREFDGFYEEREVSETNLYKDRYTVVDAVPDYLEGRIIEEATLPFFDKEYLILLHNDKFKVFYEDEKVWIESGELYKNERIVTGGSIKLKLPIIYRLIFPTSIELVKKED